MFFISSEIFKTLFIALPFLIVFIMFPQHTSVISSYLYTSIFLFSTDGSAIHISTIIFVWECNVKYVIIHYTHHYFFHLFHHYTSFSYGRHDFKNIWPILLTIISPFNLLIFIMFTSLTVSISKSELFTMIFGDGHVKWFSFIVEAMW